MSEQLSLFDQTGPNSCGFAKDERLTIKFNKNYPVPEAQLIFEPPRSMTNRPQVMSSKEAERIFREGWPKGKIGFQEYFYMMMLNRNNSVLGVTQIASGGVHYAPIDLRIIFAAAIKSFSSALIFRSQSSQWKFKKV